jgi:peroxiredoxin
MSKQSRRPGRAARHQAPPVPGPNARARSNTFFAVAIAALVVGLIAAAITLGGSKKASRGLALGSTAPGFSGVNVLTGRTLTSDQLAGKKVLYFFNEGVMCQACLVQIQSLEKHASHLAQRGITLVSITNDDASTLRQAGLDYHITTPLIADTSLEMTQAFGALGGGMHADTADHTFILVDKKGIVRFDRDYPSMWIDPQKLLDELPKV